MSSDYLRQVTGVPAQVAAAGLPDVFVLNGISSAGKSTVVRSLQALVSRPYLVCGVDTLIDAMPRAMTAQKKGLIFSDDGRVEAGVEFTALEDAWYAGLAAMARAGVGLILDEVFLGGVCSQAGLRAALAGLHVAWVGVDCDLDVAVRREGARAGRTPGMAAAQGHWSTRALSTTCESTPPSSRPRFARSKFSTASDRGSSHLSVVA